MRSVLIAAWAGVSLLACAHGPTNEQRLEAAVEAKEPAAEELRCRDTSPEISIARDTGAKLNERLTRYGSAIADAKGTSARFDQAFKKDPDLMYGPEADAWKRKQAACTELVLALEKEKASLDAPAEVAPRPSSAPDAAFAEDDAPKARKSKVAKTKVAKATSKKKHGVRLATR